MLFKPRFGASKILAVIKEKIVEIATYLYFHTYMYFFIFR